MVSDIEKMLQVLVGQEVTIFDRASGTDYTGDLERSDNLFFIYEESPSFTKNSLHSIQFFLDKSIIIHI